MASFIKRSSNKRGQAFVWWPGLGDWKGILAAV